MARSKSSPVQVTALDATAAVDQTAAKLLDLFLYRVRYTDRRADPSVGEAKTIFILSARLFSDETVGVEFGTRFKTDGGLVVEIIYRMQFGRGPGASEQYEAEAFAQQVAARIAPVVAFPFVRETLSTLTGKSSEAVLLPIMNIGTLFDPETVPVSGVGDQPAEAKPALPPVPSTEKPRRRK